VEWEELHLSPAGLFLMQALADKKRSRPRAGRAGLAVAEYVSPMKALGSAQLPEDNWHCEIKFDGYRAVAVLNDGRVELWSRNHKPLGPDYPEIVEALATLKCRDAVLDGEIVALDSAGRSRFQLLQGRDLSGGHRPVIVYYVFDLMHHDGRSLMGLPIEERKKLLGVVLKHPPAPVQISTSFDLAPAELMRLARQQGLEGIMAKRPGSHYEPGRRSGAWVKCKCLGEQEFVIGGFTRPQNSRQFFGALLLGYFQDGKLLYAGKVGTGFDRRRLTSLHATFLKRVRRSCPFANLPMTRQSRYGTGMTSGEMAKVTWIRPDLVAQIRFAEWTDDGLLRQPVFLGLRKDKRASEVRREQDIISKQE
jgi:bifunctional non-homologous end joining protein LigD